MFGDYFIAPSVTSLIITGLFLMVIFIIFIKNFKKIMNLNYYPLLILLSTITIAIGIHGILHSSAEINYKFNPYNWPELYLH